jgi:hypothetical protein
MWNKIRATVMVAALLAGTAAIAYAQSSSTIGTGTSASIIDSHPALKAASPQAPMTDLFFTDDAYHGGAFMLAANFGFYTAFKPFPEPAPPRALFHPRHARPAAAVGSALALAFVGEPVSVPRLRRRLDPGPDGPQLGCRRTER